MNITNKHQVLPTTSNQEPVTRFASNQQLATSNQSRDFLLEIGCEELPADYLPQALEACAGRAAEHLGPERGFVWRTMEVWATPRRLVLIVRGMEPVVRWEKVGPTKAAAYDAQGHPTPAAQGFAKSQGVAVSSLGVKETPKGPCIVAAHTAPVLPKLAEAVPALIGALRFPKQMRWEASGVTFARPIRWLVALYGAQRVPCRVADVTSSLRTAAPRRAAAPWLTVRDSASYFAAMRRVGIQLEQRGSTKPKATALHRKLAQAAKRLGGRLDEGESFDWLLTTVTFLAESPVVQAGTFRKAYLTLPPEVLATAMAKYLKVFSLRAAQTSSDRPGLTGLLPTFLAVLDGRPARAAVVMANYERILEARFTDAQFFWREDTKTPLAAKAPALKEVVFHQRLGTLDDKTGRLLHAAEALGINDKTLARAIHLAKADLVTQMVKEFPTLQGLIGAEYARHDREPPAVIQAIREQYAPRTASDPIPASDAGAWLSLLDRADTLTGFFGVGLTPTSSEDPYGLRRQAAGLVRILVEKPLALSLDRVLGAALESWGSRLTPPLAVGPSGQRSSNAPPEAVTARGGADALRAQLTQFLIERFRWWACDVRRYPRELVEAVLAAETDDLAGARQRLEALHELWRDPRQRERVLFTAGKVVERTGRIVASAKEPPAGPVEPAKFRVPEEQALWTTWTSVKQQTAGLIEQAQFKQATAEYGKLYPPLHQFFEKVFIMDDDPEIRQNRLAMMREIHALYATAVGDLSKLPLPTEVTP